MAITKTKIIAYSILVLSFISLSGYTYILNKNMNKYKSEAERQSNNVEFYEGKFSKEKEKNIALKLTIDELNNSKDSIVNELAKFKKKKKIKTEKPGDTYIHVGGDIDTSDTIYIENEHGFKIDTTVVFNEQTKSHIKIDSTGLVNSLDIDFGMNFSINGDLVYKNERKNWFDRLVHLDYKKKPEIKYNYEFTNDAIKPKDIRVVVIEQ